MALHGYFLPNVKGQARREATLPAPPRGMPGMGIN